MPGWQGAMLCSTDQMRAAHQGEPARWNPFTTTPPTNPICPPPPSAGPTHPLTIVRAARLAGACAFRSGRRTADTRPRYAQTSVAATVMSSV